MALTINTYLKKLSSDLFIKHGSSERTKINKSVSNIKEKIHAWFGDEINEITVFGSYSRDTILPRAFDDHSDIDILIQFNTDDYKKLKPESYRSQLLKFAVNTYPNSIVVKDHPSIVVELNFIKYDLVPCIFDEGIFYDSIEIPDKDGGWMETEPEEFNQQLIKSNTKYNSIVKPIVRLLKYWNSRNDYPFASFELETAIAEMDFERDNVESGFLYAIGELSSDGMASWAEDKFDELQKDAEKLEKHLENENQEKVEKYLAKILG